MWGVSWIHITIEMRSLCNLLVFSSQIWCKFRNAYANKEYIHMYVSMRMFFLYTYIHTYIYIYTYMHAYIAYIYIGSCMCERVFLCVCACVCVCLPMHIYFYTMHIHIYIRFRIMCVRAYLGLHVASRLYVLEQSLEHLCNKIIMFCKCEWTAIWHDILEQRLACAAMPSCSWKQELKAYKRTQTHLHSCLDVCKSACSCRMERIKTNWEHTHSYFTERNHRGTQSKKRGRWLGMHANRMRSSRKLWMYASFSVRVSSSSQ